jgi:septal ring factor EnvC (AmiA/AmiB activator)
MATKMQINSWMKQIDRRKDAIGKERDKLDDLIGELQSLKEDCVEAHDALQTARDALSRLV